MGAIVNQVVAQPLALLACELRSKRCPLHRFDCADLTESRNCLGLKSCSFRGEAPAKGAARHFPRIDT